jgi:pimeloyl-ACP methyl ester carboxylesterase
MDEPWHFERITLPSGLNMRIARAGQGPLVVMLHGFPECWYSWRHQLRALSSAFECVAPDMRGYGETDAPEGVANYRIEKLVEDVAGLITRLGRQRAHVIGHDWGGAVAWATAIGRPEVRHASARTSGRIRARCCGAGTCFFSRYRILPMRCFE